MKKILFLTTLVAVLATPAAAGLFSAKGDSADEKRAAVRKQRDEILAKLYAAHPDAKEKMEKAGGNSVEKPTPRPRRAIRAELRQKKGLRTPAATCSRSTR